MAEILRDLAAQVRFRSTRNELVDLADNLDRLAAHSERRICGALDWPFSPGGVGLPPPRPARLRRRMGCRAGLRLRAPILGCRPTAGSPRSAPTRLPQSA